MTTDASSVFMFDTNWFQKVFLLELQNSRAFETIFFMVEWFATMKIIDLELTWWVIDGLSIKVKIFLEKQAFFPN